MEAGISVFAELKRKIRKGHWGKILLVVEFK